VTGGTPAGDLAEVEAFFRRSGLPHLTADGRRPRTARRRRATIVVGAWLALGAALIMADLPWWVAALVGITIPALAAGVSYLLLDLGVLALFVHQGRPALDGLRATTSVAIRALPPLLAVLLFLSLASETWRAFGRLEGWRYGSVLIGFGILSAVILSAGLRRERHALLAPAPGAELESAARATPAAALVEAGVVPEAPPLDRLARINVSVALLVSLGIRVLAVGAVVCLAFIVFGMLIVDRALTAEWAGQAPHVLLSVRLGGREVILSEALVRVATTLGAFASLYFAGVAMGDTRNREQFLDDELERLAQVMAAWSYYRGALTSPSATYQSTARRNDSSTGV
jgi:hypothetical protein